MKSVTVAAAVVVEGGKLFATQRGYGDYKGYWEFPGGKIEPGETAEQALVREMHEELAADISIKRKLCHVEYDYPKFHLSMECFLCTLVNDEFTLLEHSDARWVSAAEIDDLQWLGADIEVLEALKEDGALA